MRKVLFLFALVLAYGTNWGQYTMNSSDIFAIGESRVYNALDTTGIVEGMGGTGLTWDFSGGTVTTQTRVVSVIPASSHPEAADYPTSTHAVTFDNGEYFFYTIDSDSIIFDGEVSLLNSPINYSIKPKVFAYPLNQNDIQQDSLYSFYNTGSAGFAFRFGNYNTLFDGSGTLILPGGITYNNVNRTLTFIEARDSSQAFPVFTDIQVARYEWWVQGVTLPVMVSEIQSVSANGGAPTTTKEVFFLDSSVVAIDDPILDTPMEIFPNPATNLVQIRYQLNGDSDVSLRVFNMMGEEIWLQSEGVQMAGEYSLQIPTDQLSRGVYMVQLNAGKDSQTKKLILK